MGMLSNDIVIHLEHVVLQGVSLKVDGRHASRFLTELVAEIPVRRFLALPGRGADSGSKGSLGKMSTECGHQRLTAIVKGRQLGAEELKYVVVSLVFKQALARRDVPIRECDIAAYA